MPNSTPHGTPTGYDDGCRGANCKNHRDPVHMTCAEAHQRYQGDWEYIKAVDAGTVTTEKASYPKPKVARLVAETAAEKAARPVKVKKPRVSRAKPKTERKPRALAPLASGERKHGTPWGIKHCTGVCPNEAAGGKSCHTMHREYQNAYTAKRRAEGNFSHGSMYGYQMGCHDRATCPMPEGLTCMDEMNAYGRARAAKARA